MSALPKCKPCGTPSPVPPVVPAWSNPTLSLATSSFQVFHFVPVAAALLQVAKPNPKRVGIGFSCGPLVGRMAVGVSAEFAQSGWPLNPLTPLVLWFTLLEHGPLVCAEWWCYPFSPAEMNVTEIYRLQ